jgi:Excalibur calcium-binding domain
MPTASHVVKSNERTVHVDVVRLAASRRQRERYRRTTRMILISLSVAGVLGTAAACGTDTTRTAAEVAPTVTATVTEPAVTTTVTASPPTVTVTAKAAATPKPAAPRPVAPKPPVVTTHAAPPPVAPAPPAPPSNDVYYANCTAARAAGAAPILRGEPGYRPALDRDDDGVACE